MIKWILLLLLAVIVVKCIQNQIKGARRSKAQKKRDETLGIGPYHKKARDIKSLSYASECLKKGKKEKGLRALEEIASQEGWLENTSYGYNETWERFTAASILFHLAVLGSCEKELYDGWTFSATVPEYKSREKAKKIAGWLLEEEERDSRLWAQKHKRKPEEHTHRVYFVLALLCTDAEERFARMKKAAEFQSDEARWWLLRNGLFERAFPDKERQKEEYFNLYYALERHNDLWTGSVGAELPLKRWMIREGGFPEKLTTELEKYLGKATAIAMRREVVAELESLKRKKNSVGKDTLERIERQNKVNDEELKELIIEHKIITETAAEYNQWMEEMAELRAEAEAGAAGRADASQKGSSSEFSLASMPAIVYDSSSRQWKRRGIYGDHAVYYNDAGGEVTIYSAQVSGNTANTSAGTLHWY